ncbi:MAG TPA: T9SS type A sorting domain-containing protein [Flavobacteriales bacterium]|nr:T9SS type A sorting domain-containing protein [Flavobacteriales bacterium]HMR25974.1 T9SS type A sorting domain-containing protein [Flavobacteriales bacterium]
MRNTLFVLLLAAFPLMLSAQWVPSGMFSSSIHFQACAFHTVDSGLFVYGANNPGPSPSATEGGLILTINGAQSGGFYLWYEPSTNLEDIDVKVTGGRPLYMAAGHELYNRSIVVRSSSFPAYPLGFDSVRTGVGRYYRAIRMRDDLVAFAAGGDALGNGIIDMSTDSGSTWSNIAVLPGQPVSRLHFVNDLLGFAATGGYRRLVNNGVLLPDSGAIYRTTDGGLSWAQVHADATAGFSGVAFSSTMNGVATRNDGVILRTQDGGSTWSPAVNNHTTGELLTGATFRSDGVGFITGYRTDGTAGYILFSDDGGATWDLNYSTAGLNSARRLYDVRFFDVAHGYAMGQIRPLRSNGVITAVEEVDVTGFTLFPNPAHDAVTIEVGGAAEVRVLDAQGRVVRRVTTSDRAIVPLDGLGVGAYVAEVRQAGAVRRRTFLRN